MLIVPRPFKTEEREGAFDFSLASGVSAPLPVIAEILGKPAAENADIVFAVAPCEADYVLEVSPDGVRAESASGEGLFHAAVTLKQLAQAGTIPACRIEDKPRFAYRAGMIDVCRHFFGVETVKKLIDTMALFKFNHLHFHVSDDQGFRLKIDSFPRLHQIGSVRPSTCADGKPHGGYYTKQQIAEIVDYAAERFITVVPEIDLPGHTRAMLAAYPELGCSGKPTTVATWFGIHSKILCAGKESVYDALDKILAEVAEMFPSELFHIGGDEVAKLEWSKCADCAATIKREGLAGYAALQGHFTNRVIAMLKKHGKTPILWNEALDSDMLDPDAVVQYWAMGRQPAERVCRAVREEGRKIIMSRCDPYYLDYPCGMHSLKSVYGFEPCLEEFGEEAKAAVVGVECPLWTEHVADEKRLFFMFYPRAIAVAESGWSTPEKDYEDFERRLCAVVPMLAQYGVEGEPVAECNPGRLKSLAQASSFGMKMQRRADIASARNWRSMHMK